VGQVQRAIEAGGLPTIGITLLRAVTEAVKPPRALYVGHPFGHPLGEAFRVAQQRAILLDALRGLQTIVEPGTILDPGYRWRRSRFPGET
jgi:D-proline reductase (dithiol) PrdB